MKKYLLNDKYCLRGWEDMPRGLWNTENGVTKFMKEEEFAVLLQCDGRELPDQALTLTQQMFLDRAVKNKIVHPAESGETLKEKQKYLAYPSVYKKQAAWSVTGACNYNCRHCFMSSPKAVFSEPDWNELTDVITQLEECGIHHVMLTGGEPLVSPYFMDICKALQERDIVTDIICSNGSLIDEDFLIRLRALGIKPVFSLSYDGKGWHDWLRGVDGAENKIIDVFRLLKKYEFTFEVAMCLHRHNLDAVNESLSLLDSLGCVLVKMEIASPAGLWAENTEHFASEEEVYRKMFDTIIPCYLDSGALMTVQFESLFEVDPLIGRCRVPVDKESAEGEMDYACRKVKFCTYISPEGVVLPCISACGTAIAEKFENLHKRPLREILTNSKYRELGSLRMKDVLDHNKECRDCPYRCKCGGGCRVKACGSDKTDYLAIEQKTCNFYKNGWYEKGLELCSRYRQA